MQRNKKLTEITISNKNIQQKLCTNIISTPIEGSSRKIFAHTEKTRLLVPTIDMALRPAGWALTVIVKQYRH